MTGLLSCVAGGPGLLLTHHQLRAGFLIRKLISFNLRQNGLHLLSIRAAVTIL